MFLIGRCSHMVYSRHFVSKYLMFTIECIDKIRIMPFNCEKFRLGEVYAVRGSVYSGFTKH
jgi:hypothetical protein